MNYFTDMRSCISLCTNISSCNGFSLSLSLNIMKITLKTNYFADCYFICD